MPRQSRDYTFTTVLPPADVDSNLPSEQSELLKLILKVLEEE